MISGCFRDSAL